MRRPLTAREKFSGKRAGSLQPAPLGHSINRNATNARMTRRHLATSTLMLTRTEVFIWIAPVKTRGHGSRTRFALITRPCWRGQLLTANRLLASALPWCCRSYRRAREWTGNRPTATGVTLCALPGRSGERYLPAASISDGRLIQSALSSRTARRCCLPHPRGIRPAKWRSWAWARSARRVSARLPVRQSTVHGIGKELRAGCPVESRREAVKGARQRIRSRRWNTALAFR